MGKNTQGGKKTKKRKNANEETDPAKTIVFSDGDDQKYAIITKVEGGGRYRGLCDDGTLRLLILRGNMKKRKCYRPGLNDYVLVALRDFQDEKADIIHKYTDAERPLLVSNGCISALQGTNDYTQETSNTDDLIDYSEI